MDVEVQVHPAPTLPQSLPKRQNGLRPEVAYNANPKLHRWADTKVDPPQDSTIHAVGVLSIGAQNLGFGFSDPRGCQGLERFSAKKHHGVGKERASHSGKLLSLHGGAS